jgi:glycosyltransferase involved in cell wall biosynthesis
LHAEIRSGRYDLIVLYAVPTTGWQTVAIAKRAGVPVVFRALDVSHKIRASPLAPLIRLAEKYIYRNATLISANNPAMADYCVGLSGRAKPAMVNLPPIDLSHFETEPQSNLRASLGLTPTDKVLLYMGSFFPFSGLDTVIRGFADVMNAYPDLRLVLVGGGDQDAELRELTERLNLGGHVIFTGVVPYAKLPEYLKIADVAINPFAPQLLTNVAFPHKVLQYMAASVPTVSTSLTGLRGVLGEHSGVTWVPDSDAVLAAAIRLAYAEPEHLDAVAAQQKAFIAATFSKEESVRSFEDTLEQGLHFPLERVG